jgi:menaquinone-9 beta-reductase
MDESQVIINEQLDPHVDLLQLQSKTLEDLLDVSEVLIIGGGVAGLIAAIKLARLGHQVTLAERKTYPRDKVCGACLNANALATFDSLQLTPILDRLQAPHLQQVQIRCGRRQLALALPAGRAITRYQLDLALAQEAQACGVHLFQNTAASIEETSMCGGFRLAKLQRDGECRTIKAKMILVAAGLNGVKECSQIWPAKVARHSKVGLGLTCQAPGGNVQNGTIYLCVRPEGYLGVVRGENGILNLAAAVEPALLKSGLDFGQWAKTTLEQYQLSIELPSGSDTWRGTPQLTRRVEQPYGHRWLAIGDAAGYVEPFTGEGMAWALASAELAATHIHSNFEHWSEIHGPQWQNLYRGLVRRRQFGCRALAWLLKSPTRSQLAIELATWFPQVAAWMVRDINQVAQTPSIISPSISQ